MPPKNIEHVYVNRKSRKTYNVQGVCGPKGEFIHINVKFPGSTHDARVYNESGLKKHIESLPVDIGYLLGMYWTFINF